MNADRKQKADRKKREKEARKKIYAIFKQIKAGCDQLKKFEETLKEVKKLGNRSGGYIRQLYRK